MTQAPSRRVFSTTTGPVRELTPRVGAITLHDHGKIVGLPSIYAPGPDAGRVAASGGWTARSCAKAGMHGSHWMCGERGRCLALRTVSRARWVDGCLLGMKEAASYTNRYKSELTVGDDPHNTSFLQSFQSFSHPIIYDGIQQICYSSCHRYPFTGRKWCAFTFYVYFALVLIPSIQVPSPVV